VKAVATPATPAQAPALRAATSPHVPSLEVYSVSTPSTTTLLQPDMPYGPVRGPNLSLTRSTATRAFGCADRDSERWRAGPAAAVSVCVLASPACASLGHASTSDCRHRRNPAVERVRVRCVARSCGLGAPRIAAPSIHSTIPVGYAIVLGAATVSSRVCRCG